MELTVKIGKEIKYLLEIVDDLLVRFKLTVDYSLQILLDDSHFGLHAFKSINTIIDNIKKTI